MPGGIPGPLGAVAFAGVKLGGYYLAGLVLKKAYVPILAGALKIAGARLGVGILLSPVVIFGGAMIANHWPEKVMNEWPIVYAWLVILRLAVWVDDSNFCRPANRTSLEVDRLYLGRHRMVLSPGRARNRSGIHHAGTHLDLLKRRAGNFARNEN
jgi:hypothetical protein